MRSVLFLFHQFSTERIIAGSLFILALCQGILWLGNSKPIKATSQTASIQSAKADSQTEGEARKTFARLPLGFAAHREQDDQGVKFTARGAGYSIGLATNEIIFRLQNSGALRMKMAGAKESSGIKGTGQLPGKVNYLSGNDPAVWQTDLPVFSRVCYDEIYSGISAIFYGNQRQLEYDFVVAPQADPQQIKLAFDGAEQGKLDVNGDLLLSSGQEQLRLLKPVVYQETNGVRRFIPGSFKILNPQSSNRTPEIGFELGDYDHNHELVIDPVLSYSSFLGGSGEDQATGVAVDGSGNVYVTGTTASMDFSVASAQQAASAGSTDIFVTKMRLNADGLATVLFSTYIGGRDEDRGNGIALDADGNVYITGATISTNFPTVNGQQTALGSAAVFKSANAASAWTASGGGLSANTVVGLAIDPGNANTVYAATSGGGVFRTTNGGGIWLAASGDRNLASPKLLGSSEVRAVIAVNGRVYAGTSRGLFSTTDGGATWNTPQLQLTTDPLARAVNQARENVRVMAVDPANSATVYTGTVGGVFKSTDSGLTSVPVNTGLPNIDATTGLSAATVQVLAAGSSNTVYAGANGGVFKTANGGGNWTAKNSGLTDTNVTALAVDSANANVVYAGTPSGVFKSANGGDSWVTSNTGLTSTPVRALAIDGGSIYALTTGGIFKSTDAAANWAASNSGQTSTDVRCISAAGGTVYLGAVGASDGFLLKLAATGNNLLFSTYLGGGATDTGNGLAYSAAGNVFITGTTNSTNFPLQSALANALAGSSDAFAARINTAPATGQSPLVFSTFIGGGGGDLGNGISVDSSGNVYLTGVTASPDFPTTDKALQKKYGNNAAFKTIDSGGNWAATGAGITGDTINALAASGGSIFAGNPSGVFKSTDGGVTWVAKNNGLSSFDVRALSVETGAIYAGTAGGVFKSIDGGDNWAAANTGLTRLPVLALAIDTRTNPATLFAGINGGGVFKSTNAGASWTAANGPKQTNANDICASCLPNTEALTGESLATVTAIVIGAPNTIFAAIGGGGIFKSTDGGSTWSPAKNGFLPSTTIQALAVDTATTSTIFAGTNAGVFKTTDAGANWQPSSNGLLSNDIRSLAISASVIYAGTSGGIFKSTNGGANWNASRTGLTSQIISVLLIDGATVYAGTGGGSGDAFLTKLSGDGSQLLYSTFIGGGDRDAGNAIALGSGGSVLLTGSTSSNNFPTTTNAFDKTYGGRGDAFVTEISPVSQAGEATLSYSTFLGGGGTDQGNGVAVDASGRAHITGSTGSADFTVVDAIGPVFNGALDAFVALIDVAGGKAVFSAFLGGSGSDSGSAIAVDSSGGVYVVGNTLSANFPLTEKALDKTLAGSNEAFVVKIGSTAPAADLSITKEAVGRFRVGEKAAYTITVRNDGPGLAAPPLRVVDALPAELGFDSFTGTDWNCSASGQIVTCTSAKPLAATAETSFTLTVKVNSVPEQLQPLVNTATVQSLSSDTASANNSGVSAVATVEAPCSFTISPNSQDFTANGGTGGVSVTTQTGCDWQAAVSSGSNFITIESGTTGSSNGSVNFRVAANTTLSARAGSLTIAGQVLAITQAGAVCQYSVVPDSQAFDQNGGSGVVTIQTSGQCSWQVSSDSGFVTLSSAGSGSGNGAVMFNVAANPGALQRAGNLMVTGLSGFSKTISILQGSATQAVCTFKLTPASESFAAKGGDRAFFVDVSPSSCEWTATTTSNFVVVTSDRDQSGSAYITYLLPQNLTGSPRSGSISISQRVGTGTIPRETFNVRQDGQPQLPSTCVYSLIVPPSSQNFAAVGGEGTVLVSAGQNCAWQSVVSAGANFISIEGSANGSGSGSVKFRVAENLGILARSGTLTIAGQTVFIHQSGVQTGTVCALTIDPAATKFNAKGGDSAFFVNSSLDTCEWTVVSNSSFIRVTSDRDQSGSAFITFVVEPNTESNARSGTITVGAGTSQTFTITQAGLAQGAQTIRRRSLR